MRLSATPFIMIEAKGFSSSENVSALSDQVQYNDSSTLLIVGQCYTQENSFHLSIPKYW